MLRALVHFIRDDIVGNDVMKSAVRVMPLIAVERDSAGPAVIFSVAARVRRDVAVVIDYVVIGHEVVALDRSNAGATGIADSVSNEAQMVRTTAKKTIAGLASAV